MAWRVVDSVLVDRGGYHLRLRIMGISDIWAELEEKSDRAASKWSKSTERADASLGNYRARFVGTRERDNQVFNIDESTTSYVDIINKTVRWEIYGTLYLEIEYTPPSTPSSISVPTTIKGGESITVSWGSSSGATRYHLERRVNSGTWTQIYSGGSRSYTDTITKGWNTVAYRVRAYNSDGYSSYRTSPTRTVINFPEMQIKINGVLKTSENGWVKINGVLREIDSIYVKVNGQLKEVQ